MSFGIFTFQCLENQVKKDLVGPTGFKPATSCTPSKCSIGLSHGPTFDLNDIGLSYFFEFANCLGVKIFKKTQQLHGVIKNS